MIKVISNPKVIRNYKINPIAKLVAFLLKGAGIPFADEICKISSAERTVREVFSDSQDYNNFLSLAPFAVLRWYSITGAIMDMKASQVWELEAGLNTRGVLFTRKNQSIRYIETDLNPTVLEKMTFVKELLRGVEKINYIQTHFNPADDQAPSLEHYFNHEKPLTIIHDLMFARLTSTQRDLVVERIRSHLRKESDIWITPDIFVRDRLKGFLQYPSIRRIAEILNCRLQCDLLANAFQSSEKAVKFFEKHSLCVERKRQLDFVPDSIFMHRQWGKALAEELECQELWFLRPR